MSFERVELEDGSVEEIVYLNDDDEVVPKSRATRWILHRFDSTGRIVESFYGGIE